MSTIAGWLEGLGFAHYVSIFAEHAVDIDVLFELTEADLERLGLPLGDRKRMLKAIASYISRAPDREQASRRQPLQRRAQTPSGGISRFCFAILSVQLGLRQSLILRN